MASTSNKPRVFVSSTIRDFVDLRAALKYWLEELGLDVCMSEYNDFVRRPEEGTFESCFNAIVECDFYILLIGARRGSWYDEKARVSVTQQEYRVAARLAAAGKIKPVLFARQDVRTALRERRAARGGGGGSVPDDGATPSILDDPEFIASFIDEVETTEVQRLGIEGPAGVMWLYSFADFRDVVDALQVILRLHHSVRREALLANLRWEIDENLTTICQKVMGGIVPRSETLGPVRGTLTITAADWDQIVALDRAQAGHVAKFYVTGLPAADRLLSVALSGALQSGEFLVYSQSEARLVDSAVQVGMRRLAREIHRFRLMRTQFQAREASLAKVIDDYRS